jgi:hypothetical protein
MRDLLDMLEMLVGWYEQVRRLSPATQRRVLKLGNRLERVVGIVESRPTREPA